MIVTVGRAPEFGEGQKIVKEVAGHRILLVRHHGVIYAISSNCFHMGAPLVEGDLEDMGSHPCVVCPMHRYRIDMKTGHKVDKDLCGGVCESKDQKQRTYLVYTDGDKIQVYIPDASQPQAPLPSDKYNYWSVQEKNSTPPRQGFGLLGSQPASQPATPSHLEPYAGMVLSQPSPQPSPAAAAAPQQQQPQQEPVMQQQRQRGQALPQGQIQFRAAKARAAIMNNYKPPPMAEPAKSATAARGLFGAPAVVGSGLFGTAGASSGRGLGQQQVVAAGPTDMEMD